MREYYTAQLETLNTNMIQMGALCEDAISAAIQSLLEDDRTIAKKVADTELEIDQMERDIERQCMRLLLMQQPVATDLRVVSSALRMIADLERIGDQAFDIADITKSGSFQGFSGKVHIKEMAKAAIHMVTDSVDSYVKQDVQLAKRVTEEDDVVDELFLKVRRELAELIHTDQNASEQALDLLMIAKYLERIGDHAVNVSEWVIYSVTGKHMQSA
ncbi:phosphate signaling complex protein PhoU [uncultured Ruminococcus sp.]|uniref:phosphate signaling complex protein PhoU n=2 Tax=Ruminococcus TaxID=1263 RepID=UPI002675A6B8|nr:phosphate signaling complex protein PhoU [uncultured Ruminococcus sp.]